MVTIESQGSGLVFGIGWLDILIIIHEYAVAHQMCASAERLCRWSWVSPGSCTESR